MIDLIHKNRADIEELCRRFRVSRLEVFGSAVTGHYDAARSDVDFLVEFNSEQDLGPWLAHFFGFKRALEEVLHQNVDLVMTGALRNRYFIDEVNRTRTLLYAA